MSPDDPPVIRVHAGGHSIRAVFYDKGKRFVPTIVFLHEGLGSIAQWKLFPDTLARTTGCNALVYERRGHGASDPLTGKREPDFMEREAERVLPELLEHFGLDKVILYGHSDGGSIALLFAAFYPEYAQGLLTEAAHVFVEDKSLAGVSAAVERFGTSEMEERLALYHGDNTESMFRGWADIWLSPQFRSWSIPTETLRRIKAPVLAFQGTEDEYGSTEQLRRIKNGIGKNARTLLIPNCAHFPHVQACKAVMKAASDFITSIKREEE